MIKIYFLEPASSVFNLSALYADYGVELTTELGRADVVILSKFTQLNELSKKSTGENIQFLLWTNEPRWSSSTDKLIKFEGKTISIMNCYTGDVYVDVFHYLWVAKYKQVQLFTEEDYNNVIKKNNKIVSCVTSNHGDGKPFLINNTNCDLYLPRKELALYLWENGLCDIYGQGWPDGVALVESRVGEAWIDWESRKINILSSYLFNICYENTNVENYVTEKFWHPIMARTMPVYFGKSTGIYQYFPEKSFIDAADFESFYDLKESFLCMDKSQYIEKMNVVITIFNRLVADVALLNESRRKIAKAFCERVKSLLILIA